MSHILALEARSLNTPCTSPDSTLTLVSARLPLVRNPTPSEAAVSSVRNNTNESSTNPTLNLIPKELSCVSISTHILPNAWACDESGDCTLPSKYASSVSSNELDFSDNLCRDSAQVACNGVFPTPPPYAVTGYFQPSLGTRLFSVPEESAELETLSDSNALLNSPSLSGGSSRAQVNSWFRDSNGTLSVFDNSCMEFEAVQDSEDDNEDPFLFDKLMCSPQSSTTEINSQDPFIGPLSFRLSHQISFTPLASSNHTDQRRFSITRKQTTHGMVFTQRIGVEEGKKWTLRVPATGLPHDMVALLQELEALAVDLQPQLVEPDQDLPTIVITQSAQSLSPVPKLEQVIAETNGITESAEAQRPPYDSGKGEEVPISALLKGKSRAIDPVDHSEATLESTGSMMASPSNLPCPPSDSSLTCIYLPDFAPEFLSGSSTSPVLEPAYGFHSRPAPIHTSPTPHRPHVLSKIRTPNLSFTSSNRKSSVAHVRGPIASKSSTPKSALPVPPQQHNASQTECISARRTASHLTPIPCAANTSDVFKVKEQTCGNINGPLITKQSTTYAPATSSLRYGIQMRNSAPPSSTSVSPSRLPQLKTRGFLGGFGIKTRNPIAASTAPTRPQTIHAASESGVKSFFTGRWQQSQRDMSKQSSAFSQSPGRTSVTRPTTQPLHALVVMPSSPRTLTTGEPRKMPRLPSARNLLKKLK